MNLRERFTQQQSVKPTDLQKMRIYQKFLDKSYRSLGLTKIIHYLKVGVFSFVILVVGGASYFALQDDVGYQVVKNDSSYKIVAPHAGAVQADVLGKIVQSKGEIAIIDQKNTTTIMKDTLRENEHILLSMGAEIEFTVRDNVLAKVLGPAEFEIQDLGAQKGINNYAINIISGDYFEVTSINKKDIAKKLGRQKEQDNIYEEDALEKKAINHIIVKSPEFTVETKQVSGNINIVMSKQENGKREVKNKGAEIVMKTIIENEQKFIAIERNQTVAVNGHVEFVDVDVEKFKKDIKEKQFAVRYEIKKDDNKSSIGEASVDAVTIADVLEETKTLDKKVIDSAVLNDIDKSLRPVFLDHSLAQMQKYYIDNNSAAFRIAYKNLLIKLSQGYKAVGIVAPTFPIDEKHLLDGANMADALASTIVNTYSIDTSHLIGLYVTANSLRALANTPKVLEKKAVTVSTKKERIIKKEAEKILKKAEIQQGDSTVKKTLEEQLFDLGIK